MTEPSGLFRQSYDKKNLQQQAPLRLLILEDAQNSAEQLVSHLRNAGLATRVHRITSGEDLNESLGDQSWDLLIAFDDAEAMPYREALTKIVNADKDIPAILLQIQNNDEHIVEWLSLGGADAIPAHQPERLLLVCIREWFNLTQRRQRRVNEIALKEAEKRCQLLLESSVDAIAYIHEGMHIHANPAYVQLFGYENADELAGLSLIDIIHRDNQTEFKQFFRRFQQGETSSTPLEFKGQREDGQDFQASMTLSSAKWDDEKCTQIVIRQPAADPELEKELALMKSTDLITGLYNRAYFSECLDKTIQHAANGEARCTVLDIRLDKFRDLKKELGVTNADHYLAEVAGTLRPIIQDHGILARYSDDVFLALINTNINDQLQALADTAIGAIKDLSVKIGRTTVETTASIGIMPVTESADSSHYILSRAEKACLDAATAGGHRVQFHDQQAEMQAMAKEGDIVALVTQALEQNQFQLRYQPVLNLEDEQEQQYEVFSRLINSEGETVPAAEFIAASKRAGITTRIDRWAIIHSIKTLSEHREKGNNTRLFITLGPESMQDQTLPSWINVALRASKLPGNALVFQVAEEDLVACLKPAAVVCENLRKLQCNICINHFGGAVDPFAALELIPADYIKLDASMVSELEDDKTALPRLQDMTSTLKQKGKKVMIPKVESSKILSTLWQCDVNYVQGYFLHPPMEAMEYDFQ